MNDERPVIWIVNPFDDLPGEGSGPLRYWTIAEVASRMGANVVWWSSDFSHRRKAKRVEPPADFPFEIKLVPTPPYRRNIGLARIRNHRAFAKNFEKLAVQAVEKGGRSRPTHIIVSSPPLGIADVAFRLRDRWGSKVVLDIMDAWPETFLRVLPGGAMIREKIGRLLFAGSFKAASDGYRGADAISGVSETYLDLAKKAGARSPMKLCYHGADFGGLEDLTGIEADEGGLLRVTYIGAMGESYDLETVMKALKIAAEQAIAIHFRLAGGGPKEESLKKLCGELGLSLTGGEKASTVRVTFCGYLQRPELLSLLRDSDLGIIPLLPESWVALPYKVGDYAAAGLAIASGLGGELDQLLTGYQAGQGYPPRDANALAEILADYSRDHHKLAAHKQNARRMAEDYFDRRKTYPDLVDFILNA